MQIDFIGCTSAGKSTLIQNAIQTHCQPDLEILTREDFVLKQLHLNWINGHRPRTILVDLIALFLCLITWRNNLDLYLFATRHLYHLPIARFDKLNLLRNILKKIGIHEIIRLRSHPQQIILVDEGILQAAHNLFVHNSVQVNIEELTTFVALIPMPDVVVYVRQPEARLIYRAMNRGHRRLADRSYNNVAPFIKKAVAVFETLIQQPSVTQKLLLLENAQIITLTAKSQDNPVFGLATKIIWGGISSEVYETSLP